MRVVQRREHATTGAPVDAEPGETLFSWVIAPIGAHRGNG
jgi:hypothetical protein